MTSKLGTLTVDLLAKTGSFETDIKRAARTTDREMDRIGQAATRAGAIIGTALVAGAAAAGVAIKSAIDSGDEISKLAQKIGIPTEALSRLSFAAELSDVSLSQLQSGISRLVRTQTEAATEGTKMARLFDAIGVSAKNSDGTLRASDEVLRDLADRFKTLPDGAEKTALALDIFGRSGAELIPLLNLGADGLAEMDRQADIFGRTISTETGRQMEAFNDQVTRLTGAWKGFSNQLATTSLPTLRAVTDALVDLSAAATQTLQREGLFADDFFGKDSGLIAQLFRDRGFESPSLINTGDGPTLSQVLGGARAPGNVEFITPDNLSTASKPPAVKDAEDLTQAIRRLREEDEKRRSASEAASASARSAAAAAARLARDEERAIEDARRAYADFNSQLADLEAEISGPLAEAELEWQRRQEQLEDLAKRGQISQEQLARALGAVTTLRDRDIESIKERQAAIDAELTPTEEVIASLQEELRLLGLSNTERAIENALRFAGADATKEQRKEIASLLRQTEEARERIQFSDDIRRGFEDTFASIIDGSKSAKEALEDLGSYITSLIAQRLSAQLVDSLFGSPGGPLGGSTGGGLFSSILGSLFGGGRAAGGWVAPGKMYEVAENGPELLRVGNRQFLLPTATGGMVTPNARMGGGVSINQTFNVTGRVDSRTASQIAVENGRAQRRAAARFGA